MEIIHTSPVEISKINSWGMLGECLCFSSKEYVMTAAPDYIVYTLDIEEDEIIEANSFFYRDDYEKLNEIIAEVMDLAECDRETAEELLSQRQGHEEAEVQLRIQGYTGEAAKALGYKAAEAVDEQGTVYIVPMLGRESDLNIRASV